MVEGAGLSSGEVRPRSGQDWGIGRYDALRRWVAAARAIHAVIVAEGVEDAAWVPGLEAEGVQAVQGYVWGKPTPQTG